MRIDDEDLMKYMEQIKVNLCDEKCPCCGRICGVFHDSKNIYHECKFGHQIQAFGGMKLKNGYPSTKRCEELVENDEVIYNGDKISWGTFKKKVKANQKWTFEDCENINLNKVKMFEKAWKIYGPTFC